MHLRTLACCATLVVTFFGASLLAVPPTGFEDSIVAAVGSPTALAFTPDGRLLITTQTGTVRVIENDVLRSGSALNLSSSICTNSERGVLGVAVDPAFSSNHFIYVYYTFNKFGVCEKNTANSPVNRVSRFTLSDASVVDRASELVLIDGIPSPNGNHNGGDVQFGPDGYLYVSAGDGGCDYLANSGCAGQNDASRDQNVLSGKLMRVTRDGAIPPGNPFVGTGTARCNVTGRTTAGLKCQETYAWGFRNPFRFAFDREPGANRLFVNDVGQDTWEEVNQIVAGADYGWNTREGRCANGSTTNCGNAPAGMTDPIYAYGHGSGCASITGGAFVPAGVWPSTYTGAYIFGDYVCGSLFTISKATDGTYVRSSFDTGLGSNSAVAMTFGPFGGTQALYYTTYANGGQVRRIAYTGNRTPIARAAASPTQGALPLAVRFDASASSDPDGDTLTYDWDFGDGSAHATAAVVTHSYVASGQYDAVVKVTDTRGASATASVHVSAGNTPPVPRITSPTTTTQFAVGQTVTLTGSATDAEDGTLPASALTWTVILHHNTHTHPFLPATSGNGITFVAPAPENLAATATSYLEIQLTATDAQGGSTTMTQRFDARPVSLTMATDPAGLSIGVNETTVVAPKTVTSWVGYVLQLSAATQVDNNGQAWIFAGWSDGGAATHNLTSPATGATYTARYVPAARIAPTADAFVRGGIYAGVNYGTRSSLEVKRSASSDNSREGYLTFDLSGATSIGMARLRLYGALADTRNSNVSTAVHGVSNTTWTESGLKWSNRPAAGAAIDTAVIANATPGWHEWDITAYLRAEKAAGRSIVSLLLRNPVSSSPPAIFNAREAAANAPELFIAAETSAAPVDIVLRAGDARTIAGLWTLVADATAAGGSRLSQADAGAPKRTAALAAPQDYVDVPFTAEAGVGYRLWIRGRAARDSYSNDSAFVQFSTSVDDKGQAMARIGSTAAVSYVLESCSGCGVAGWGWEDNGYGTGVLGPLIYFATSGPQTLRIQTREDGLSIDQIVLSPGTYLTSAPGAAKNDNTIVPR